MNASGSLMGNSSDEFKKQEDCYNNRSSRLWFASAAMQEFAASSSTHKMTVWRVEGISGLCSLI